MAKGVLGNDPFLRGAPARPETAIEKAPAPAPAKKAEAPPAKKGGKRAAQAPVEVKQWPTAAGKNDPARASVRVLMSEESKGSSRASAKADGSPRLNTRSQQ